MPSSLPLTRLAALLCVALSPSLAAAEERFDDGWMPEDARAYGTSYNGAFTELGARYGTLDATSLSLHGRFAFPMSLLDSRLSYTYARDLPHAIVRAHRLDAHFAVHPLYLLYLDSDWLGYVLGSIYLEIAGGPHLAAQKDTLTPGLHWSYGAGIEAPLLDPDRRGHAPWLSLAYSRTRGGISSHALLIGLAWRFNRLPF